MKKLLLVLFTLATVQFAVGQVNYFTDFNDSIPGEWKIIDADNNDTTWVHDAEGLGIGNTPSVYLDTYDGDAGDYAPADDWLISPVITVVDQDMVSFYARGGYDGYPDSVTVMATKQADPSVGDFNITLGGLLLESEVTDVGPLTKFSIKITDHAEIAGGDDIRIGIYCASNGSEVYLDNFKVAQPNTPLMVDAFSLDKNKFLVRFDDTLPDPITAGDFTFKNSGATTLSDLDTVDLELGMYSLTTSGEMTGDNIVDTIIYPATPDTMMFYGGILPMKYANLGSSEIVSYNFNATYSGTVFAKGGDDEYWVASDSGAYKSIRINSTDSVLEIGDSIIFNGKLNPYRNLSELYPTHISQIVATGKDVFPPVEIDASEIDTSITADQLPAEKYENVLAILKNVTIEKWDGAYYFFADDGTGKFRIGNDLSLLSGLDSTTFGKNSVYNITGIVSGYYGTYSINPRNVDDIELLEDNTAPEAINLSAIVTNVSGEEVPVKSTEAPGFVYIIHEDADQSTISELDTAVAHKMGAKAEVTLADEYVYISTEGLVTGLYNAYAVDTADNISAPNPNQFTVRPVAITETQTLTIGEPAVVQSTAINGKVYMVLDDVTVSEPADLETAVNDGDAASADVTAANTDIEISTDGLSAGSYYVFAVDAGNLMSAAAENKITLEEETTGIEDLMNAKISMYPNPVVNNLTISADIEISRIVIYNALGKQIRIIENQKRNEIQINTSELEEGVYFISLENQKGLIKTEKFVKSIR